MGLNEAAGYGAVAVTALATGYIAEQHGLRPAPFFLGLAYAGLGLGHLRDCSSARPAATPASKPPPTSPPTTPSTTQLTTREVFALTSFREKALSSARRPGSSTTSTTASPGVCSRSSSPTPDSPSARIGVLAAIYPAVWGLGQLVTGALSDRIGRKPLIAGGMLIQAVAIAMIAATERLLAVGARRRAARRRHGDGLPDAAGRDRRRRPPGLAGPLGRHLPACGATPASRSAPSWPAILADARSIEAAIYAVAALTAASGVVVIVRMYETHPPVPAGR